jgi:hypothetical protein
MKFRVTMKDPDGVHECVRDAVEANRPPGLSDDEWEDMRDDRIREACKPWFEYMEYLTVEVDTEARTCVVVKS